MLAIIGPTASGKSELAVEIAEKVGYSILSLDSLAVYKEVDILSAKPTPEERRGVPHYGIDLLFPNQPFDITKFISLFRQVQGEVGERVIIVGGSGFYLKGLIEGLSPFPPISPQIRKEAEKWNWDVLSQIDPTFAKKISPSDRYRIRRGAEIYLATGLPPTHYFQKNPPIKLLSKPLPIFEISLPREVLRERIWKRTKKMFQRGIIDEVAYLEWKYRDRELPSLKAIGAREILDYFNGDYTRREVEEKIAVNTSRLAKRQTTFNRTQFPNRISLPPSQLKEAILESLKKSGGES